MMNRKLYMGGTDVSSLITGAFGRTALKVYMEKRGLINAPEENTAMRIGKKLEQVVFDEYCLKMSDVHECERVTPVYTPYGKLVLKDDKYDWMIGHPDGVLYQTQPNGETKTIGGLELKTTSEYAFRKEGMAWGEEYTDEVPLNYSLQVQWYMGLDGLPFYDVAVLVGGRDIKVYRVERDDDVIMRMRAEAIVFWDRVRNGDPPPPSSQDTSLVNTLYPAHDLEDICEADIELTSTVEQLDKIRINRKAVQAEEERLKNIIKNRMKTASVLTASSPDKLYTVTWKTTKDSTPRPDYKEIAWIATIAQYGGDKEKALEAFTAYEQTNMKPGRKGSRRFVLTSRERKVN